MSCDVLVDTSSDDLSVGSGSNGLNDWLAMSEIDSLDNTNSLLWLSESSLLLFRLFLLLIVLLWSGYSDLSNLLWLGNNHWLNIGGSDVLNLLNGDLVSHTKTDLFNGGLLFRDDRDSASGSSDGSLRCGLDLAGSGHADLRL